MKSHNLTLDILKVVMAFMVVALHRTLYVDCNENLGNVVDALVHIAVPTFFIINGYYFASIKEKIGFRKCLKRWGTLYLTWTIIYGYFIVLYSPSWQVAITDVFMGYFHLWYVVNTIYAFLVIWCIVKCRSEKWLYILAGISAIIGVVFAYQGVYDRLYRNFMCFALPFITIGYFMNKKDIRLKRNQSLSLLGISLIMLIGEYYIAKTYMGVSRMELGLSLYFVCPILFFICKNCKFTYRGKFLADFSTGIFLTHQLALSIISKVPVLQSLYMIDSVYRTIVNMLVASLLSIFIIVAQRTLKLKLL